MQQLIVGISDCKVSGDTATSIMTYALGSCVGVALYDPDAKIAGLLHILLPNSINNTREDFNHFMFADTGLDRMIREMMAIGVTPTSLIARIAGGANMLNSTSVLDIGRKNVQATLQFLERTRIPVRGSSVGGTVGRSMQIEVGTGRVLVKYLGGGELTL